MFSEMSIKVVLTGPAMLNQVLNRRHSEYHSPVGAEQQTVISTCREVSLSAPTVDDIRSRVQDHSN